MKYFLAPIILLRFLIMTASAAVGIADHILEMLDSWVEDLYRQARDDSRKVDP